MKTICWVVATVALAASCGTSSNASSGGSAGSAGSAGAAGSGGTAGSAGASAGCAEAACSAGQICVAYRTVGGAQFGPDDAGTCMPGRHLEQSGTVCNPDFQYQCGTATGCVGAVSCACGASACPSGFGACSETATFSGFVDSSAALVCQLLAP